jgi:transcriptional regulator with XRE-family HTH domain
METTVGQRVKEVRKYLKMSQDGLAKAMDVTQSAISRAEDQGSVSNELAEYMRKTHKVNLNWLFTGEGEMIEKPQAEEIKALKEDVRRLKEKLFDASEELNVLYREKLNVDKKKETGA